MTTQTLTFEGGTPGTLTTTNPPTSGNDTKFGVVTTTGTATASVINTDAAHGTQAMECVQTSTTSSSAFGTWSGFTATSAACRFYFKITSLPSTDLTIMRSFNNSSVRWLSVAISPTNKLSLRLTNSDTVAFNATTALSANTWYRVEWSVTMGNSSNAVVNFQYYVGDSTTPVETGLAITNGNTGTGTQMADFRFGIVSSTAAFTIRMDDLAINPGTTTFIGVPATPPTAAFTATPVGLDVNVDGTASTAVTPATISSYDWDWGDGSAHGSGSTATHTYSTAGTYTVGLTVTDSNSLTNLVTHSVTITAPTTQSAPTSVTTSTGFTSNSGTALNAITDRSSGVPVMTTFVSGGDGSILRGVVGPITPPVSGSPLVATIATDRFTSTTGTITAKIYEKNGTTLRSTVSVSIPDMTASGGSGDATTGTLGSSSFVAIIWPWSDVQNVSDWNQLVYEFTFNVS